MVDGGHEAGMRKRYIRLKIESDLLTSEFRTSLRPVDFNNVSVLCDAVCRLVFRNELCTQPEDLQKLGVAPKSKI